MVSSHFCWRDIVEYALKRQMCAHKCRTMCVQKYPELQRKTCFVKQQRVQQSSVRCAQNYERSVPQYISNVYPIFCQQNSPKNRNINIILLSVTSHIRLLVYTISSKGGLPVGGPRDSIYRPLESRIIISVVRKIPTNYFPRLNVNNSIWHKK